MSKKCFFILTVLLSVFFLFHPNVSAYADERKDKVVTADADDTTEELQSLLNYNRYGLYNLTVKIPKGTYDLTDELHIYSNTTILADSDAKFMKNHQKGAMLANDLTGDKGGYNTSKNIHIIGGIWDASIVAAKKRGTECFRFIHGTNITVKDVTICNVPENSHMITFAGVKNGVVDSCNLYGYEGSKPKEAIQIDIVHDSVIVPSSQTNILKYDDLACNGITVKNCNIYDYPRAIGSHTSIQGVFHKNIVITGNTLHDLSEAAIKAYNYMNVEISDNTISNAGVGVLVYTYISNQENHYLSALKKTKKEPLPLDYNIVIKNNTIKNIKRVESGSTAIFGEGIRAIGIKARPLSGVTIENNTITKTEHYGIYMQGSPGSTISDNNISSTSNSGIYLTNGCNYSDISANTLTQSGNSYYSTAGGIGISASTDVVISGNSLTTPRKNGISLYNKSKTCNITNNSINGAGDNAIALFDDSNETTISGNSIEDYRQRGIYTYQINSAIIDSNKIYGQFGLSKDGIYISGNNQNNDSFTVTGNYIKTSIRYGIYINNAPKSYIGNNTITSIIQYPIYMDKGSNGSKVCYNTISMFNNTGKLNDGIDITRAKKVLLYENIVN